MFGVKTEFEDEDDEEENDDEEDELYECLSVEKLILLIDEIENRREIWRKKKNS